LRGTDAIVVTGLPGRFAQYEVLVETEAPGQRSRSSMLLLAGGRPQLIHDPIAPTTILVIALIGLASALLIPRQQREDGPPTR
jgi:hypothetical protein